MTVSFQLIRSVEISRAQRLPISTLLAGLQRWRAIIDLNQMAYPISIVAPQSLIALPVHLSCPDNLCLIDLGAIIDPLLMNIVLQPIPDEQKMLVSIGRHLPLDPGSCIGPGPGSLLIAVETKAKVDYRQEAAKQHRP